MSSSTNKIKMDKKMECCNYHMVRRVSGGIYNSVVFRRFAIRLCIIDIGNTADDWNYLQVIKVVAV